MIQFYLYYYTKVYVLDQLQKVFEFEKTKEFEAEAGRE